MNQPILCGTDFSATASEAADVAAGLARRLETGLVLVHIDEFYGMAEVDPSLFEGAIAGRRDALEREAERLRSSGANVETRLLSGSIFEQLVTAARETDAHTLVVGAVGHGLSHRLLLGSVAERTAEMSPIPTLIVRPNSAFLPWLGRERPLKVLVGSDFSAASDAALAWVKNLQSLGASEINVLHIGGSPVESQLALESQLSEQVVHSGLAGAVTVAVESSWGSAEGALFQAAQKRQSDLVVVGTHQRHGLSRMRFGSVSRAILRHATVSVTVVPPPEAYFEDVDATPATSARSSVGRGEKE
jgi:nucleotide-binding universal stress UspA family protein